MRQEMEPLKLPPELPSPAVGVGLPGVPVAYPDAQPSAFAVKYITLAVVAAVLAFALGALNGWQLMVLVLVYGLVLILGWVLLAVIDSRQFLPMLAIGATFQLQCRSTGRTRTWPRCASNWTPSARWTRN